MHLLKNVLIIIACVTNSQFLHAQTEMSALSDYVNIYKKYLHRDEGSGTCAMYPSCSQYGLIVFEDCYFPKAMMYMADRLIRCGHDFNCYDLTLNKGQLLLLDFPPYAEIPRTYIHNNKQYYSYTDWDTQPDSTLLFINHLINKQMYQEALIEIEKTQFQKRLLTTQLFTNKLICYKGLGQVENAIFDYEVHFPEFIKNSPKIKFEMLDILLTVENYDMAHKLLSEISDNNIHPIISQKYAWQGIFNAYQENWDEANKYFNLLASSDTKLKRDKENFQLIQEAATFKKKKPWVASSLSLIPGLGYVYTQRPKSALTSFVMNSLLGYAVFTSIKQKNYGTAALLGVFNLSFYIGNISVSKRSASQYNQRKLQKIQTTLYQNNKSIN